MTLPDLCTSSWIVGPPACSVGYTVINGFNLWRCDLIFATSQTRIISGNYLKLQATLICRARTANDIAVPFRLHGLNLPVYGTVVGSAVCTTNFSLALAVNSSIHRSVSLTRKLCYRKDGRAMRHIWVPWKFLKLPDYAYGYFSQIVLIEMRSLSRSWDNSNWSFGWGLWNGRAGRRGSRMVLFERALVTSYRPSIVTFLLS